jgi:ABC-type dipeptide/oligopeptide/nickel transport system ATPase subunit
MNGFEIQEPDWKRWRVLREVALERYCTKILDGLTRFQTGKDTAHERYLKLWKYLRKHNRMIGIVFDNPRRSVAYMQMHAALSEGLITRDELEEMSEQTQQRIDVWLRG